MVVATNDWIFARSILYVVRASAMWGIGFSRSVDRRRFDAGQSVYRITTRRHKTGALRHAARLCKDLIN